MKETEEQLLQRLLSVEWELTLPSSAVRDIAFMQGHFKGAFLNLCSSGQQRELQQHRQN